MWLFHLCLHRTGKLKALDGEWIQVVFEAPELKVGSWELRYGGQSEVQLQITYIDDKIRLGKGSRGSLFVFQRRWNWNSIKLFSKRYLMILYNLRYNKRILVWPIVGSVCHRDRFLCPRFFLWDTVSLYFLKSKLFWLLPKKNSFSLDPVLKILVVVKI